MPGEAFGYLKCGIAATMTYILQGELSPGIYLALCGNDLTEELDQAVAQRFGDRFGFGMDLELLVDFLQVKRDRLDAHP